MRKCLLVSFQSCSLWLPSHYRRCVYLSKFWNDIDLLIETLSAHNPDCPTVAKQLSVTACLYHPTVNQSQMLAHQVASVNTLMALYCNFAKKNFKWLSLSQKQLPRECLAFWFCREELIPFFNGLLHSMESALWYNVKPKPLMVWG